MKHENENAANLHTGLKRREFMAMLAGCTAGLMVPSLFHGEGKIAAATASRSDRLGPSPGAGRKRWASLRVGPRAIAAIPAPVASATKLIMIIPITRMTRTILWAKSRCIRCRNNRERKALFRADVQ